MIVFEQYCVHNIHSCHPYHPEYFSNDDLNQYKLDLE